MLDIMEGRELRKARRGNSWTLVLCRHFLMGIFLPRSQLAGLVRGPPLSTVLSPSSSGPTVPTAPPQYKRCSSASMSVFPSLILHRILAFYNQWRSVMMSSQRKEKKFFFFKKNSISLGQSLQI